MPVHTNVVAVVADFARRGGGGHNGDNCRTVWPLKKQTHSYTRSSEMLTHSGNFSGDGVGVGGHNLGIIVVRLGGSGQIPESNQNTAKQPKYRKAHINTGKHPNIGVYGGKGWNYFYMFI